MPDDERHWVIDAAKTVPGVLDAYHLFDPVSGNGLSIAFLDDEADVAEVKSSNSKKAEDIGWVDVPRPAPTSETIYRVVRRGVGQRGIRQATRSSSDVRVLVDRRRWLGEDHPDRQPTAPPAARADPGRGGRPVRGPDQGAAR